MKVRVTFITRCQRELNKKLVVTPIVFLVILGILIYKNTRSELLYKKDIYVESVITAKSKKQVELSKQTIEKEEESEKEAEEE